MGELLTIWSVRLAVGCYLGRYLVETSSLVTARSHVVARSPDRVTRPTAGLPDEVRPAVMPSAGSGAPRTTSTARLLWTAGCSLYVVHVLCAFAFVHNWSHAEAYAHTAEQTQAVIGWDWGGGLYFNYLFTIVWIADVVRMWRNGDKSQNTPWRIAAELFMAFMVVNATVVFGPPVWRWIGAGFFVLWASLLLLRKNAAN